MSGLSLVDARPYANAVANKGRKGGYENVGRYSDTELVFLNIDNIHVMRNSLASMHKLITSPKVCAALRDHRRSEVQRGAAMGR